MQPWEVRGDWANRRAKKETNQRLTERQGDKQTFDPAPEDFEADQEEESEAADPPCEEIITKDSPELGEQESAPVRGRSRVEFPESRNDDPLEQGEPYLAKPRSLMNRPTTDGSGKRASWSRPKKCESASHRQSGS
jgi:hypothetical protein